MPPLHTTRRAFLTANLAWPATAMPAALLAATLPPTRLAALDWSLIEVALTLGIVPVAAAETAGYRSWVRTPVLPATTADLGLRVQPNLELLRMMAPGLILTIPDRADIAPELAQIAPLLSLPIYTAAHDPYVRACAVTRTLGARLGDPEAANAAIARAETAIGTARAQLRGPQPPVSIIRFVDAHTIFLFGAGGLFESVMRRLGINNGWQGPATRWGFVQTSIAALAAIAPHSRLFIINPTLTPDITAMMRADPLWLGLPSVRNGHVRRLPPVWFFGATASAARFAAVLAAALAGDVDAP